MGIYWYAVDEQEKKQIWPPSYFANKSPGVFHPNNPFPGMVTMMNVKGYHYEIHNDFSCFHDDDEYENITDQVYEEYKEYFKMEGANE